MKKHKKSKNFLMSRNAKGVVKVGKTSCKIPLDKSMLSIFATGANAMIKNGHYKEDGWIYVGKKKVKKWFSRWENLRVWEPVLNDVAALERRYQRVLDFRKKEHETKFDPIFEKLAKVEKAHAQPTHKYTGDRQWWIWRVSDSPYGKCYGFDWVDEPETPLHHDIGQKFYEVDRRMHDIGKRVWAFRIILERAIEKYLMDNHKPEIKDEGTVFQLILNGRTYWYICCVENAYAFWKQEAWPGDKMKIVELR